MAEESPYEHLLEVNNLKLSLNPSFLADRPKEILHDVTFNLDRGECLAILGETASGKSLLLRALTRFFHDLPIREVDGKVIFEGRNLLRTGQSRLLSLRGAHIAYVLQGAHQLFNPRLSVRQHFDMILRMKKRRLDKPLDHVIDYLYKVGIVEPESVLFDQLYPTELDTATRQKLALASALVCEPDILIADELTAEFDSGTVAQMIDLFEQLKKELGTAFIVGTGRIRRAEQFGDRIAILSDGKFVESSTPRELFQEGVHQTTRAFVDGTLRAGSDRERLVSHYYNRENGKGTGL